MTTPEPPQEGQPYHADPSAQDRPYYPEPPVQDQPYYPEPPVQPYAEYPAQQYPAAPYPPQQYPPQQYPPQPYPYPYPPARQTNGMAIAAMVLGIVWVYGIGSILALVFGYLARAEIKRTGQAGDGMAVAGIVLGWVGVGVLCIILIFGIAGALS
jgi:hypothetical protein